MSQEKNPFQEILTSIDSRLKKLELKSEQSPSTEKNMSSEPPHEHSSHVKFSCPECQKAYDADVTAKVLSSEREKRKQFKDVEYCEDCGEVYDGEESEDCPTCHRE